VKILQYILRIAALAVPVALVACGGGGSGDGGSVTAPIPPTTSAALSFNPGTASATLEAGKSSTLTIKASVNRPADFTGNVYAVIVDSAGVLLPTAKILSSSATEYSAVLQTSATLAAGNYKGNFTVNLCKDTACAAHWPGSPMQLPYDFNVVAAAAMLSAVPAKPLMATMHAGGPQPAAVTVQVKGDKLNWTVSTQASFLKVSPASGSGDGTFTVSYDSTGVAPNATVQGDITVSTSDGQKIVLPAGLQMLPAGFSGDLNGFTVSAVNGAPIPAHQVQFSTGGQWSATAGQSWLAVTPGSGAGDGQLNISVDPARGKLGSGSYAGSFTLSAAGVSDRVVPVNLTLTKAELSLSSAALTLGGAYGRDTAPVALTLGLNTQSNAWPWTLSGVPAWASPSAASGMVSQAGTSLQFAPNLSMLPVGTSSVLVTATAIVNGDTVVKPVTLSINRDQQKLVPSSVGVAMVSTPAWQRLSSTLNVRDNFGAGSDWTAVSNQSWLSVSRSGDMLTLSANPTGLQFDSTSYATVTITPANAGVTAPEVVRDALWKGSFTPVVPTKIAKRYDRVVADPIRPLIYAHDSGSTIDVYNVYTGQRVATTAILGGSLGDMALSPNGDRLYVYELGAPNLVVVDLNTMAKQATWRLSVNPDAGARLKVARPNGEELVLTFDRGAYRAATGQRLDTPFTTGDIAVSPDGRRLFIQNESALVATLNAYDMDFSAMGGGTLFAAASRLGGSAGGTAAGEDLAISVDGTRIFAASATPARCTVAQASDLSWLGILPGGDTAPNNVEVDSFGRVYCGIASQYTGNDVFVHSTTGSLQKTFRLAGSGKQLLARQMVVSGDGMMLIGLSNDPRLTIIAVGP
jgi:hypothetical protein